jgi:hypothetical protein
VLLSQGTFTPGFDVMPIATPNPACSTAFRSADGGVSLREALGSVEAFITLAGLAWRQWLLGSTGAACGFWEALRCGCVEVR